MRKKREREPEQINYRIEYIIDNSLPTESFLTATNALSAIRSFALICIKFSEQKNLSEKEKNLFIDFFSNQTTTVPEKPKLMDLPEKIPDLEVDDLSVDSELEDKAEQTDHTGSSDTLMDSEGMIEDQGTSEVKTSKENINPVLEKRKKHAAKQAERLDEIRKVKLENLKREDAYDALISKATMQIQNLKGRLSILTFEEYNRWSDKWSDVDFTFNENIDDRRSSSNQMQY